MIRVADYVMNRLFDEGVHHIFFIPGTGCMFLADAIARHKDMVGISVHHEQAGAMAALSYANYNENLGACLVTTGCGGTNTITGVLHAWQDSIPCVFISGQAKISHTVRNSGLPLRQLGRQEADIIAIVESITKYSVMITDASKIAYHIDKALYMAKNGRKGPAWLDIPLDIQNAMVNEEELERYIPFDSEDKFEISADDLEYVRKCLNKAERPVLLIGNGVRSAKGIESLEEFIKKYKVPVTYTRLATDIIETESEFSIGMVGSLGASRAGNFAVQNADLIISIGCRLAPDTTGFEYDKFGRCAKLVVVDIDSIEHSKNTVNIDKFIKADAKKFLEKISGLEPIKSYESWHAKCLHWKEVFPVCTIEHKKSEDINMYYFMDCLSQVLPEGASVLSDAGCVWQLAPSAIKFKKGQRSIHSYAQGEMGYSLPGAVGVSYASKYPVVALTGDGSFMMNIQELQTIVHNEIPVKICVMNNNGYSSIRHLQSGAFRGRKIGTDYSNGISFPNLKKIAEAFEIQYIKISGSTHLTDSIKKMLELKGPVLCEVMCVNEQDFIETSATVNSKKRFVTRPIEDQAPFIDRKLFLSEMIIEPIDQ